MKTSTRRLALTAMLLAMAAVLSLICEYIPFLHLPAGGTFTIASMLPIVLAAYIFGTPWGLFTGLCYSVVQMFIGISTVSALFMPGSDTYTILPKALLICLIDYIIAYTALGFGGVFRKRLGKTAALTLGSVLALGLRYAAHTISGTIFYGEWAEWFFTQEGVYEAFGEKVLEAFSGGGLAVVYSLVYNGLYMIPEIIITAAAAALISRLKITDMQA